MDNIFSKIIAREIPANIIYEDEIVMAFLDNTPINKGHTLVVPKKHFTNIFDCDPEILGYMMKIGQKIGQALKSEKLADGVNLIMNNGESAGQIVWYAHLHVIPRLQGDDKFFKPKHVSCTPEEFLNIENILTKAIK